MIKLNRGQLFGLDLDRHIALDAGAGTGKTLVMAKRYVQHLLTRDQRSTRLLSPGPREDLIGKGLLTHPQKDRTSIHEWGGLLPEETVAITFTRKAATELRARIRKELTQILPPTVKSVQEDIQFDPRLRSEADLEMLLSKLDSAPITTIDAFLSSLISPWVGMLSPKPVSELMEDEIVPLLNKEAIRSTWKVQNGTEAFLAGVRGDVDNFVISKNRVFQFMGGQYRANKLLEAMMRNSLFVEESRKNLVLPNSDEIVFDQEKIELLFTSLIDENFESLYQQLHKLFQDWVDVWLDGGGPLVVKSSTAHGLNRFQFIQYLLTHVNPISDFEKIQWIWYASVASSTKLEDSLKSNAAFFSKSRLSDAQKWAGGLKTKKAGKAEHDDQIIDAIYSKAEAVIATIREEFNTPIGYLSRNLGNAAALFSPFFKLPNLPEEQTVIPKVLTSNVFEKPPSNLYNFTKEMELSLLRDLFITHRGVKQILRQIRIQKGLQYHDDRHELAEDLLLTRCPHVCRDWYPNSIIKTLDSLALEPWSDHHIHQAILDASAHPKVQEDLEKRFHILMSIRRKYRAYIIDEFQDTNPQHYRLLCRLWGRREREPDCPEPPAGDWDPTVCIVGDMKQSIYRFRQADVRVMKKAVASIREINRIEQNQESRLKGIRFEEKSRDPRPVGGGVGKHSGFVKADTEDIKFPAEVRFHDFRLGEDGNSSSESETRKRSEGHIELSINHRTSSSLLTTLNHLFADIFDSKHHEIKGDWHARPQPLTAKRESNLPGRFEWLMPVAKSLEPKPIRLDEPLDAFKHEGADLREQSLQLMTSRIASLINGEPTKKWNSELNTYELQAETYRKVKPEEILILAHSKANIIKIVRALESRGIPAVADREGPLLAKPVVKALVRHLRFMAYPDDENAVIGLLRNSTVGLDDVTINQLFSTKLKTVSWLDHICEQIQNQELVNLILHSQQLSSSGYVKQALEIWIDHSDLFLSHPSTSERKDVENFLQLLANITQEVGHDATSIYARLNELSLLDSGGPTGKPTSITGAVKVMTIHQSKGLESPVVILFDPFSIGQRDSSLASQDHIKITPDLIAPQFNPWPGKTAPLSGLWNVCKVMENTQDRAERRRQLYVSLTRVRDLLIIVGAPKKVTMNGSRDIVIPSEAFGIENHGAMLLQSIWTHLHKSGEVTDFVINPSTLHKHDAFMDAQLDGIHLYHHMDCFEKHEIVPEIKKQIQRLSEFSNKETKPVTSVKETRQRIYLATHDLHKESNPEFVHGGPYLDIEPTIFGEMFHRLIEIGLPNPAVFPSTLNKNWLISNEDGLTSEEIIDEILSEFSIKDRQNLTEIKRRLLVLGRLVREGALGTLANGHLVNGMKVIGLRTELPFWYRHEMNHQDFFRYSWTPRGKKKKSRVDYSEAIFEGRIDLVLILEDEDGDLYAQVIDAKTTGAINGFNETHPEAGHPLQQTSGKSLDTHPLSDAEKRLLESHRLQLILYQEALKRMMKTISKTKDLHLKNPAIYSAASGRLLTLDDEAVTRGKEELDEAIMIHLDEETSK